MLRFLYPLVRTLAPKQCLTFEQEVARAIIHAALRGSPKSVCEIADIRQLAE